MEFLPEPVSGVEVLPYRTTTTPAAKVSLHTQGGQKGQWLITRQSEWAEISVLGAPTARSFAPSPSKSPQARDSPKADPYARTTFFGSGQLPRRTISAQAESRNWSVLKDEAGGIVPEPVAVNPCSDPWMIVTSPVREISAPKEGSYPSSPGEPIAKSEIPSLLKSPAARALPNRSSSSGLPGTPGLSWCQICAVGIEPELTGASSPLGEP